MPADPLSFLTADPSRSSSSPSTYPGHFETRFVSTNGGIRWYGDRVPVSRLLAGHNVGLEEIDHGLFEVYFGPIWLGRFVESKTPHLRLPRTRAETNWRHLQRTENCHPGLLT